jgi:uncharacterized integral membrane protein
MPRCQGTTKAGSRCKLPALEGEKFCHHHLPAHTTLLEDFLETLSPSQRIAHVVRRTLMDIRWQFIIVGLVFIITFVLSRDNNYFATLIEIPHGVIIEFLSALSQALGVLLGILLVFLPFNMTRVIEDRQDAYREFRSEIEQLHRLLSDRPDELRVFDKDIASILLTLKPRSIEHFPIEFAPEYDGPSWHELTSDFYKKADEWLNQTHSQRDSDYFMRIAFTVSNIKEILRKFLIQYLRLRGTRFIVEATAKVSVFLGASLILLLAFGTIDRQDVFPELRLPIIFAIATWLMITLFELIEYTRRFYRNFQEPWEFPD